MPFKEKLEFLINVDDKATKKFEKIGKSADESLKKGTNLGTQFGGAFEKAAAKSPLLSGALDKVGLSATQAGTAVASALPAAALVAGGAIAAFGIKAVGDFQDLGSAVLDFQRVAGTSAEDSSRFVAVLDDFEISAEAGATAIGKLAKTAANSPESFAKFGVEIARNKDGTVDLQGTLLNAAEAYQSTNDQATKAALGAALFGKGYQTLIPILEQGADGADGLAASLADVSGQQILSQDQIDQAESTRLALDELSDSAHELTLALGSGLSPAVGSAAESLATFVNVANKGLGAFGGLGKGIDLAARAALPFIFDMERFGSVFLGSASAADRFGAAVAQIPLIGLPFGNAISAIDGTEVALTGLASVVETTKAKLEEEAAALQAFDEAAELGDIAATALASSQAVAAEETRKAAEAAKAHEQALRAEAEALQEAASAELEKVESARAAADATFAAQDASDDYADALAGEGTETRDVVRAAAELADANVRVAEETANAAGQTFTATQRLDGFNGSMVSAASQAAGPLRQSIVDYIAEVNEIPESKASEILALIDQGKLDEANAALADASRARESTVTADAQTAEAEANLNQVARDRTAKIRAVIEGLGGLFATGGTVENGQPRHAATGAVVRVGEQGPEDVALFGNGRVLSRSDTIEASRPRGAGPAFVVNELHVHDPVDVDVLAQRVLFAMGRAG